MPRVDDLNLELRTFLQSYRWRRLDPVPVARLAKPPDQCRVALVSSAGLVTPGDPPFDHTVKGGDFSHRWIAAGVHVAGLEEHHRSKAFDHGGIEADRNVGMPLDRLHELAAAGEIGGVAPRHVSLMGSITAPTRLAKKTAPAVAEELVADGVEVALLVPV